VTNTITLDQLAALRAGDLEQANVSIADSGPFLHEMYLHEPRYNHEMQTGKFWEKVEQHADMLRAAQASGKWPFPPLEVDLDSATLRDGHHRSNAAIIVGWEHPIPVEAW
jgi:hypothetical protein